MQICNDAFSCIYKSWLMAPWQDDWHHWNGRHSLLTGVPFCSKVLHKCCNFSHRQLLCLVVVSQKPISRGVYPDEREWWSVETCWCSGFLDWLLDVGRKGCVQFQSAWKQEQSLVPNDWWVPLTMKSNKSGYLALWVIGHREVWYGLPPAPFCKPFEWRRLSECHVVNH